MVHFLLLCPDSSSPLIYVSHFLCPRHLCSLLTAAKSLLNKKPDGVKVSPSSSRLSRAYPFFFSHTARRGAAHTFRRARVTEAAAQRVFFPSAAGEVEIKRKIKPPLKEISFLRDGYFQIMITFLLCERGTGGGSVCRRKPREPLETND